MVRTEKIIYQKWAVQCSPGWFDAYHLLPLGLSSKPS